MRRMLWRWLCATRTRRLRKRELPRRRGRRNIDWYEPQHFEAALWSIGRLCCFSKQALNILHRFERQTSVEMQRGRGLSCRCAVVLVLLLMAGGTFPEAALAASPTITFRKVFKQSYPE